MVSEWPFDEGAPLTFGPCCICGETRPLNCLVMLPFLGPIKGHGWGCVTCGLPNDGAVAAVCDECEPQIGEPEVIRLVIAGYATEVGRVPVPMPDKRITHVHDMARHGEEERQWATRQG